MTLTLPFGVKGCWWKAEKREENTKAMTWDEIAEFGGIFILFWEVECKETEMGGGCRGVAIVDYLGIGMKRTSSLHPGWKLIGKRDKLVFRYFWTLSSVAWLNTGAMRVS
ncbi:hypothetical protein ACH5RR_000745 [Cinchona calisaya]|uniref:Uncharacterized protein n=1 Tax=Cinchona calisaya TaxID=153742 RepID=A0ABD3B2L3_9GENT